MRVARLVLTYKLNVPLFTNKHYKCLEKILVSCHKRTMIVC